MISDKDVAFAFRCETARRRFFDYCKLKAPDFYKEDRTYIVDLCDTLQEFYEGDDEVEEYRIVGSQEADPFNNKISNESPIAAAILNKKVGQTVEVNSPQGVYNVKIVSVQ